MVEQSGTLGSLIRLVRQKNGWTLREMSAKVGIPLSTLAKVEADKLSLTYDKLQQFTSRLGMTLTEFLGQAENQAVQARPQIVTGRRSITEARNTIAISTPNYDYQYLCTDLSDRRMVPLLTRIRSHDLGTFGDPVQHGGEEFIYVLEGTIEVHLQFYKPVTLTQGQGIYLDSTMTHAYIAKDCESALILAICSSEDANLADELIRLAEGETRQPD